ncbi:metallophosphoesterase family protein [Wukongibacter sp. M2B1]|uniref:metallophosphoesterase family protein n=1 Tax=Wukongibacter sp. M2B1 TaxID=3088895 RepID=UPI003D7B2146
MRIGVISDTHGDIVSAEKAIKAMGDVDLLLHAGDTYRDAELLKEMLNIDVIAVKGNTDFDYEADLERIISIDEKQIFLAHGHQYNVKYGLDRLYYKALETESDIVVFGHSHMPLHVEEKGIVFVNPGSVSRPRGGSRHSYATINIEVDNIHVELLAFE